MVKDRWAGLPASWPPPSQPGIRFPTVWTTICAPDCCRAMAARGPGLGRVCALLAVANPGHEFIDRVVVDVSGEAYLDLEKEAIGMMKRD